MKYGILVGRFQPLHAGHQHLIDTIIADGREPIIILGSAQEYGTEKNPYTVPQRMHMIELVYPDVRIRYLDDCDSWDEWYDSLVHLIRDDVTEDLDDVTIYLHDKLEDLQDFTFRGIDYTEESYSKMYTIDGLHTTKLPISDIQVRAKAIRADLEGNKEFLHPLVYDYIQSLSPHRADIMYQSEGKAPNGQPFLTAKKARGYYEYSERPGLDSIAFVLYDRTTRQIGLISESKPPLDERSGTTVFRTTAFGGSLDSDTATPQQICQTEVLEEAGYSVPLDRIHHVGTTMVSSQSSQFLLGYLVDITDIQKTALTESEVQGTLEAVVWTTPAEIMSYDDWKSIYICARAIITNIV